MMKSTSLPALDSSSWKLIAGNAPKERCRAIVCSFGNKCKRFHSDAELSIPDPSVIEIDGDIDFFVACDKFISNGNG